MSFIQYLENQKLAESTIKKHIKNIEQYGKVGTSQRIIIAKIETQPTLPVRLSYAGSLSKYLQFKNQPNDELVSYIKSINESLQKEADQRQRDMATDETLPTMKQLKDRMNDLYDKEDYKGFSVLYLMITYQVRNMDMMAKVVKTKKETNDTDNFLVVGRSQVTWIRNKYKTASKYGTKTIVIKNKKFMNAISDLSQLLSPTENIDRVMKKITGGLTEGTIAKIVLRDNNTISGLKKVSKNRGTDVNTLINSYNIT